VLIAEGAENEHGEEGVVVYPRGGREEDAQIRLIVDPIDGTRGIMYDKRAAWALAGIAPNKGSNTRLRDIEVAVMSELPTSKMGFADVLTAIKGRGAKGTRVNLSNGSKQPLPIQPSTATGIDHGFASVSNFFPGTKKLASELMEHLVANLIGPADVTKATVFDDQYISTGGQFLRVDRRPRPLQRRSAAGLLSHARTTRRAVLSPLRLRVDADRGRGRRRAHR
jgi:hypothetical protein